MNESHFDTFVRSLTAGSSRRHLLGQGLLGLVMALGITRRATHGVAAKKGKSKKKHKATLCFAGQTIRVATRARRRLLRQGATAGPCQAVPPTQTPPPPLVCTPDCTGKFCGDDGCAGSCGTCGVNEVCNSGRCQLECPSGQAPCFNVCIPESCRSQCNEPCRVIGSSCCGPLSCKLFGSSQLACRP